MFANMPLFNNKNKLKTSSTSPLNNDNNNGIITTNGCVLSSSGSQQLSENNNNNNNNNNNSNTTTISVPTLTTTTSTLASIKSLNDRNSLFQQSNQMTTNSPSIGNNTIMQNSSTISQKEQQHQQHSSVVSGGSATITTLPKPQLVFHCQLAHGSPTGLITGFASVKELYQKIAECYEFPTEEIIFCTLNTHKVDMTKLLGGQIGLDDFIFAHRKGRPKEIEIVKTEDALGLTITDNGAGYAFIKRIKEGSVIDKIPHIMVGDHIEKLNDVCVIGKRHFEVARLLKDIPTGSTFTLRLIEPMKSGFQGIGPRSSGPKGNKKQSYGSGKETLRFKANGNAEIENSFDDVTQAGIDAINALLDSFMGINDSELATQIWDLGADKTNSMDFAEALDNSDLEAFGFTDDFIIELWGAITDARHGRLKK